MKHSKGQKSAPKQQKSGQGGGQKAGGQRGGAPSRPGPGHLPGLLAQGSQGPEVRMLQMLLRRKGYDPGPIDGMFGPLTHGAVVRFQVAERIGVDGIVGPQTWGELRGGGGEQTSARPGGPGGGHKPPSKPSKPGGRPSPGGGGHGQSKKEAELRQEILRVAGSQLGVTEKGYNGGGAMKYQQYFGRGPEPWCADFVSWVYSKAGKATNNPYCPTFVQQLKKQGRWKGRKDPEPGDLVFFDWDHDGVPDHVGIVKHKNSDGSITTIEGNTANPRNGNQEGVYQKQRYYMQILGFADVM